MRLPATGQPALRWVDDRLTFDGVGAAGIAEHTGTPAFVYSSRRLDENLARLRETFAPPAPLGLDIAFSVKTAPLPRLLSRLAGAGLGAEVASAVELDLALAAGFAAPRILLDGPVLDRDTLERATRAGVNALKIDSMDQLAAVDAWARALGPLDVTLRLRTVAGPFSRGPAERWSDRFGLSDRDLGPALDRLVASPSLRFSGLAIHAGSQISSRATHSRALAALIAAARLAAARGLECPALNLGGGFPSPTLGCTSTAGFLRRTLTGEAGSTPPLECIGRGVQSQLAALPPGVRRLVIEPGRALVGDAAILLTRVRAVKPGWATLDASTNFVPESLLFAEHRFWPDQPTHGLPWSRTRLAGRTLSGGDVLAVHARLPRLRAGDLLVMLDAGAYTLSRANRFTTLVPPAYLLDAAGTLEPLRDPETVEDAKRHL